MLTSVYNNNRLLLNAIYAKDYCRARHIDRTMIVNRQTVITKCVMLRNPNFLKVYNDNYALTILAQHSDSIFIRICDIAHPTTINDYHLLTIAELLGREDIVSMCTDDLNAWGVLNNMIIDVASSANILQQYLKYQSVLFSNTEYNIVKHLTYTDRLSLADDIRSHSIFQ